MTRVGGALVGGVLSGAAQGEAGAVERQRDYLKSLALAPIMNCCLLASLYAAFLILGFLN